MAVAGEGEEDAEAEQDGEEGEDQAGRPVVSKRAAAIAGAGVVAVADVVGAVSSEEGLAGSIGDELAGNPPSEATEAVADFDSSGSEAAPSIAQADHIAAGLRSRARVRVAGAG